MKPFFKKLYKKLIDDQIDGCISFWIKDKLYLKQPLLKIDDLSDDFFKQTNLYFGVGIVRHGTEKRGTEKDVIAFPGMWLDVDLGNAGHNSKDYPTDVNMVEAQFVFKPDIKVFSGHGYHYYWLFKEPLRITNDQERLAFKLLTKSFQTDLGRRMKMMGYDLDDTSDLARLLRVPGSINHKDGEEPILCEEVK